MSIQSMVKFYEGDPGIVVESFDDAEAEILNSSVTNIESNIFAWKTAGNLSPEQVGALLSRYSRTSLTGRRLFLKEFFPNKDRGREFFESWLVDYGDDSIQEMAGGIPMSCEFISNVAVKDIEDSRFGSYIEKSTRYVFFDKKLPSGDYMFYKDPDIMGSRFADEYLNLMNGLFDSYVKYTPEMVNYIKEKNAFESQSFRIGEIAIKVSDLNKETEEKYGVTETDLTKAYENATKANALDFVRDYLPMSTLTHVGVNANARAYENLMLKLSSSNLRENAWIGKRMFEELHKITPSLVKRTFDKHGEQHQRFFAESKSTSINAANAAWKDVNPAPPNDNVSLVEYTGLSEKNPNKKAAVNVVSAILYRFGEGYSMSQARSTAESMSQEDLDKIISGYTGGRNNRRHKPGRAFENVEYLFDFVGKLGIYRDIQRHRIGTQERQNFTTRLGFNTRSEFDDIGISDDYKSKMVQVTGLYGKIQKQMPMQAQYVVTFGFNTRWYYRLNARQLYHLCELRSTPSGHPGYRKLVQDMYTQVAKVHPSITHHMKFIDMSDTQLGRLNAEIRIAQKKNALERNK